MDPQHSPDVLAAEVLHEIRQPLVALKAWLQLAQEDATQKLPIDVLLGLVARIEQQVTDFQRLVSRAPAPLERIKLSEPIREAIAQLELPGARSPKPELEIIFDVEVMGNARLIRELALNLFKNAYEASKDARVKAIVSREGLKPVLYVADWGPGLAPEVKNKIFEPFISTKEYGSGLGLSVCRRIALDHRATLELVPPQVLSESHQPSTVFRLLFQSEGSEAAPKRKRILIIEDETVIRHMFRDLLARDYEVEEVATGEEGLEALRAGAYDLVIADKNLPGVSGLDVAVEMHQHWPSVKLILMTGYPSLITAQMSVELGIYDYLVKPFDDIRVVRQKIRSALETQKLELAPTSNRRVDIYEDNPVSARQISEALTLLKMEPHIVKEAKAGGSEPPAAIVLSWDFAPAYGIAAIDLVRAVAPGVPFVVLAEHLTMDSAVESLRGGASACLPKLLTDVYALSREFKRVLKL